MLGLKVWKSGFLQSQVKRSEGGDDHDRAPLLDYPGAPSHKAPRSFQVLLPQYITFYTASSKIHYSTLWDFER